LLLVDAEGPGLEIDKYVTINFGGHTYTITDPVGYDIDGMKTDDDGQRVNGVQIKSDVTDATKKVELKNGKLEISEENAKNFYVLIRNYENLTITDMVLDGTELDTPAGDKKAYVLLNNAGKVEIAKSEQATAEMKLLTNETDSNAVALGVCTHEDHPNKLIDVTVKAADLIRGKVEVTESSYAKLTIAGGTYTVDVTTYCVNGNHTVSDGDGKYVYGAHSHNAVVTAPTCENEGYTTYTCACGNSYVGNKVAAKGHTFTNGECHCGAMCGDLNDDDKLSIADIVLLNAYVKGKTQLKDAQIYVCDVNGDEVITELDVTALQAIILGKQAVTTP
jgi:exosome complex RNA-binding protein Csl4